MTPARAALVEVGPGGQIAAAFVFPYAPETIARDLARTPAGSTETFTITFDIDATTALETGDATAAQFGIHPQLAQFQRVFGQPWLLLCWGPSRIVPVEPLDATVVELAFDASLNPLRAHVTMRAHAVASSDDPALAARIKSAQDTAARLAGLAVSGPLPPLQ